MRIFTQLFPFALVLISILTSFVTFASSFNEDERQDQSIPVAGTLVTPIFNFTQGYDNNVVSSKEDPISSWYTIFQPSLKVTSEFGEFGKHNFEVDWVFTHGAYHASGEDSYNDHDISGKLNYSINQRHNIMVQAGYIDTHDDRGTRFSLGSGELLDEPERFEQVYAGMQYIFGTDDSDMRLELEFGFLDNNYRASYVDDFPDFDITSTRDRITTEFGGIFYYQFGNDIDLTAEAWATDVNYDFTLKPQEELSSTETRLMFGAEWEATALTTGFFKVGYKKKEFDYEGLDSFNDIEWEMDVKWEPKTYSNVTLTTSRETQETNGEGFFSVVNDGLGYLIVNTYHSVVWRHEWKDRISSKLEVSMSKDVYTGEEGIIRKDDNQGVGLSFYYDMNYWLTYSLEYIYSERDSTRENLIYDRELISLGVRIALF